MTTFFITSNGLLILSLSSCFIMGLLISLPFRVFRGNKPSERSVGVKESYTKAQRKCNRHHNLLAFINAHISEMQFNDDVVLPQEENKPHKP